MMYEVIVNINMLYSLMKLQILSKNHSLLIIYVNKNHFQLIVVRLGAQVAYRSHGSRLGPGVRLSRVNFF